MNDVGGLEPVSRESTAAVIAKRLRAAIMSGHLPSGSQMGEADLAGQLGVSRGPLREAMQRLVQEGLLRSVPHRGLFVTTLGVDDVHDIYAARAAIERAACALVLSRDPVTTADRLAEVCARMAAAVRAGDLRGVSDADLEFHEVLVADSGSPRLQRMAQTLLAETRMCMAALETRYVRHADLVEEHEAIVMEIRSGDEARALTLLDAHMADAVARLMNADGAGLGTDRPAPESPVPVAVVG